MKKLLLIFAAVCALFIAIPASSGSAVHAAGKELAVVTATANPDNTVTAGGCGFSYTQDYSIGAALVGQSTFVDLYHFKTDSSGCISSTFGPLPSGTYDVFAVKGSAFDQHSRHPESNIVQIVIP